MELYYRSVAGAGYNLPVIDEGKSRALLLAAAAVFACRVSLALALIPPWQQPDEPTHVANVELQRTRIALLDGLPDPARESEILYSLANYDWWKHRGRKTPALIPAQFNVPELRVGGVNTTSLAGRTTYYVIVGRFLSWLPRMSVVKDVYALRAISAAFSVLTILVVWLGARECLGATGGATVAVLAALHPQFVVASTAVSPDAMAILLGACVWWQAAVAVRRRQWLLPLAAVWCAALAAASSDRSAVPLLAMAFVVSVVAVSLRMPFRGWKALLAVSVLAVVSAMVFGTLIWIIDALQTSYGLLFALFGRWTPDPRALNWDFFSRFTLFVFQSWWISLGWVRYLAPSWWVIVTVVLGAVAAAGIGRRMFRERDARTRMLLVLAVMFVAVQLSAVYWTYFRVAIGAQGKSLFPCLAPSLVLLWAGLEAWIPPSRRMHAAVAVVLLFAFLDSAVWALVAIPAYASF